MLKQLKRIVYQADDLEAAKGWYSQVLGSEPAFEAPVACIFQVGRNSLTVAKASGKCSEGRITAYWEVDDVDQVFGRLVELGAHPKSAPNNVLTVRVAQVIDPFGNLLGLCSPIPEDKHKTIENQPSETAHGVALARALMSRDGRDELRRPDPYSELFLKEDVQSLLDNPNARTAIIERRLSRPLYGFLMARTVFIDDAFRSALRAGLSQIVFLGAGYDTRALRFAGDLGETRVFEVDAPSTQSRKRALLAARNVPCPSQLRFVAVNFKTDSLADRLSDAGYDRTRATLFIWEGVTYYLSQESVDGTLAFLHSHAAEGSRLVLDYAVTKLETVHAGEPFLSFIDPETVPAWLDRFGFRLEDHVDAEQMVKRYLTLRDGSVAERPFAKIHLLGAEARRIICAR
jgi:methyltransferase (TIGR00027 family)